MSWPLPSFSMNSDSAKIWLEEYIGTDPKLTDIGDGFKVSSHVVSFEDKIYLTIGASDVLGPVQKQDNGKDKRGQISSKGHQN